MIKTIFQSELTVKNNEIMIIKKEIKNNLQNQYNAVFVAIQKHKLCKNNNFIGSIITKL